MKTLLISILLFVSSNFINAENIVISYRSDITGQLQDFIEGNLITDASDLTIAANLDYADMLYLSKMPNLTKLDLLNVDLRCTSDVINDSTSSSTFWREMPYGMFANNSKLESIVLPQYSSINDYAFYNCINLTTVTLNVSGNIGFRAFAGCTSLTKIVVKGSLPSCIYDDVYPYNTASTFEGVSTTCKLLTIVTNLPIVSDNYVWSRFNATATSLVKVTNSNDVRFSGNDLLVSSNESVVIYDLNGSIRLSEGRVEGRLSTELPKGIYIVVVDGKSLKLTH